MYLCKYICVIILDFSVKKNETYVLSTVLPKRWHATRIAVYCLTATSEFDKCKLLQYYNMWFFTLENCDSFYPNCFRLLLFNDNNNISRYATMLIVRTSTAYSFQPKNRGFIQIRNVIYFPFQGNIRFYRFHLASDIDALPYNILRCNNKTHLHIVKCSTILKWWY
jgi:hypothetical protein